VLLQAREAIDLGTPASGRIPAAGHAATLGTLASSGAWALKGGTGIPQYSETSVGANTAISFTLSPVLKDIMVKYVKQGVSPEETVAAATRVLNVQAGLTVDVIAKPSGLAGYWVLSGAPYQSHTVSTGENTVTFEYTRGETVSEGRLTVICESGGKVISMTSSPVAVGTGYGPVAAPAIPGYKNAAWLDTSDRKSVV
jgi:hypothetical protein